MIDRHRICSVYG